MGSSRLLTLDRLTVRLAIGIAVLVVLPLAAGLYMLATSHFDQTIVARQRAAGFENRLLESALRHQMLDRDSYLMTEVLEEVGRHPEVRGAMVVDHDGVVRLSSHADQLGVRFSRDSPACEVCHARKPEDRKDWTVLRDGEEDVLRSVLPIANRPECHRCHDPSSSFNGMLILDISLAEVQGQLRGDILRMAAGSGALTLALLAGVGILIRRLVLLRLDRLARTARAIAGGNLDERVDASGNDVVASLANDFNNMADATSGLIEAVKERERRMAGVLNSLDDGLIVLDRSFRVEAANRSISRRLCSYPEDLQGRNCRDAVGHALPCEKDTECPTARCLRTGQVQRSIYRQPAEVEDEGRVHEVYASPVFADDGTVERVVEVWRDITERVREEERLAEIERLSSLGVLASGLSHEVNTPLASTLTCAESIIGRLDDAAGTTPDPATLGAVRESADIIRSQVLRCRKITERFLRFSRGIPLSIEPLDIEEAVRNVMAIVEPTARESGIRLELVADGPLPAVATNTEVVQHVVLNVLVNAVQSFDGEGGRIEARFLVNEEVRLRIRDTGCGIDPDFRPHLFEPFRTQKPRGTGLGLFLSRNFMRRFGGDVRLVDSAVGKGSCIEIVFPRADRGRS